MSATYTSLELEQLAVLPPAYVDKKIRKMGISEALKWRYQLQESLAKYSKTHKHNIPIQMEIISITMKIERMCRPMIMNEHRKNLITKDNALAMKPDKLETAAKDKTEKTLRNLSY